MKDHCFSKQSFIERAECLSPFLAYLISHIVEQCIRGFVCVLLIEMKQNVFFQNNLEHHLQWSSYLSNVWNQMLYLKTKKEKS